MLPRLFRSRPSGQIPLDVRGRPLAEWDTRVSALLIDSLLIALVTAPITVVIQLATDLVIKDAERAETLSAIVAGLLAVALALLYYAILDGASEGATIGKRVVGIQVRDVHTGGAIGFRRALLRRGVYFILLGPCLPLALLNGLWPLRDPMRQTWYDKVAHSVVIATQMTPASGLRRSGR